MAGGWLIQHLGYGRFALVDPSDPLNPPSVTAAVTAPNYDKFTRILQGQFNNNEEARRDWSYPYEYVAIAPNNSLTTDLVWACVRCTWNNNHKERWQYRENISWNDRSLGW